MDRNLERKSRGAWKAMKFASVGIELTLAIVIGFFSGRWLDQQIDTWPAFALVGLGLGITAGMMGLYRAAKAAERDADEADRAEAAARGGEARHE